MAKATATMKVNRAELLRKLDEAVREHSDDPAAEIRAMGTALIGDRRRPGRSERPGGPGRHAVLRRARGLDVR